MKVLPAYHCDKSSSRHYAKTADNSSVAQSSQTPKKLTKTSLSKISAMRVYGRLSQGSICVTYRPEVVVTLATERASHVTPRKSS